MGEPPRYRRRAAPGCIAYADCSSYSAPNSRSVVWPSARVWHGARSPLPMVNMTEYERRMMMSGNADKAKGRIKEAAGVLTGDRKLKNEGKIDQAAGSVKNATDRVA